MATMRMITSSVLSCKECPFFGYEKISDCLGYSVCYKANLKSNNYCPYWVPDATKNLMEISVWFETKCPFERGEFKLC